jgi:putative ATPase
MKELGYNKGYQYSHDFEKNFASQEYLPDQIAGKKFFDPGKNAREEEMRKFLKERWKDKYGY